MATILVTGASSGIGRAVAEKLSADHRVIGAARRIAEMPRSVEAIEMDLADIDSIASAMTEVLDRAPHVDIVINCAGYGDFAPVELASAESAARQLQVNVIGLIEVAQRVLPGMRAAGSGRIVMVSSVAAAFSSPMGGWYHAGKAALESVTSALRLEVEPFGIDVAIVRPGPVRTDWHETALSGLTAAAHATPYETMAARVSHYHTESQASSMTSEVDTVANAVIRAALSPNPRAIESVGRGSRIAVGLARLVSTKTFDSMIRKQFGLKSL